MKRVLDFLWLLIRCIGFIWVITAFIILILFAVGSEAEGYSWAERFAIAIKYAAYVGVIFGSLLAIYVWWQAWKIERRNRKTLARKEKANS